MLDYDPEEEEKKVEEDNAQRDISATLGEEHHIYGDLVGTEYKFQQTMDI
jgi:hypothetical protein